jgi:hypothetical protein
MGDGVLAYFGYPRAQEDDAEQAVRAALALVDAVANLQTKADAALQVRIGIATGTVVVSEQLIDETPAEQAVVGETPNLAARLQTLAEPGTVLICPQTRQLTGGHFDYRDLGAVALKGWTEPVPVWQVLGSSGVASRFEAMHKTQLPQLFGRDEESELLLRRWRYATQGEGRVVVLTGEPGRTSRWRSGNAYRANPTSNCAISARRIIPTARCSRSSAKSNAPPGLNATTRHSRSWRNLQRSLRNPPSIPNASQSWLISWHYQSTTSSDCKT